MSGLAPIAGEERTAEAGRFVPMADINRSPARPDHAWKAINPVAQSKLAFNYAESDSRALTGDLEICADRPVIVAAIPTVTRQTVLGKRLRSAPAPKNRGRWPIV
jgi:hypothetical protein